MGHLFKQMYVDEIDFDALTVQKLIDLVFTAMVYRNRRGSRPWRMWLEPRSDFFHLGIFCINLLEDIRLNILRFTLYSYNSKNLRNFMSYFL